MAKVLRSNFKASIERRKHPENALSAVEVKSLKKPGRYGDGNGLHLVIDKSHAKHWILRTTISPPSRYLADLCFGNLPAVAVDEHGRPSLVGRAVGGCVNSARRRRVAVGEASPCGEVCPRDGGSDHCGSVGNSDHAHMGRIDVAAAADRVFTHWSEAHAASR
jgi:hypothetical protein